jgi:hypothetical protein
MQDIILLNFFFANDIPPPRGNSQRILNNQSPHASCRPHPGSKRKNKFVKRGKNQSTKLWSLRTTFFALTTTLVTTNYHPKARSFSATPSKKPAKTHKFPARISSEFFCKKLSPNRLRRNRDLLYNFDSKSLKRRYMRWSIGQQADLVNPQIR